MPLYDYQCKNGEIFERFAAVDEKTVRCDCGKRAKRIFSAQYYVVPDVDFLTDSITGDPMHISSRVELDRLCKENGVTQKVGKGWI